MKEVKCPFCGREMARGKTCIFCGNPLKGSPAKNGADSRAAGEAPKEEDLRWDPEKVYQQSRGRKILVFSMIAVLAVSMAIVYAANRETTSKEETWTSILSQEPGRSFSASCGIQPGMTLREMSACMESYGYEILGKPYTHAGGTYQMFSGSTVLGQETEYSLAVLQKREQEPTQRAVLHYYMEPAGKTYTILSRGPVFDSLLRSLMVRYGTFEELTYPVNAFVWQADGGLISLRYIVDSEVELQYLQEGETGGSQDA